MFKKLISDRLEDFKAIVDHYGVDYEGGDLSAFAVDRILSAHVAGKEHIFNLFGQKLRMEIEVEAALPDAEISILLNSFIADNCLGASKFFVTQFLLSLSNKEIVKNQLEDDFSVGKIKFNKGAKVSKSMLKLCKKEEVEHLSIAYSMLNQALTAKGKVVLSIDPCDYVTMSSNSSGWRSCHRLNGGEFRSGPISYLMDSSSVICYLESSKPCTFTYGGKTISHTNKSWRQIALINKDCDYAIQERQYPSENAIIAESISAVLAELLTEKNKEQYGFCSATTSALGKLHRDYYRYYGSVRTYYNDILDGMFDEGTVIMPATYSTDCLINSFLDERQPTLALKGEEAICLGCGKEIVEDSDTLYCECCRP